MSKQDTQAKIIDAAQQCFFQFGYKKTNMSLIGEYSGYSRVTVHKYFKNKTALLRSVLDQCMSHSMDEAHEFLEANPSNDYWMNIEHYMLIMAKTIFENIDDDYVIRDLSNAVHELAEDLLDEKKAKAIAFIQAEIEKGLADGTISLDKAKMSSLALAQLIDYSFAGVIHHGTIKEIKPQIHNLLRMCRLSTQS